MPRAAFISWVTGTKDYIASNLLQIWIENFYSIASHAKGLVVPVRREPQLGVSATYYHWHHYTSTPSNVT